MLKTVSKEEMYLICAQLKNEISLIRNKNDFTKGIMTVCNEMIDLLDRMPQLEKALKLQSLVKDLHNHVHNH